MVSIIWGSTEKPAVCNRLAHFFESNPQYEGHLYLGYPIIGSSEGAISIDGLLVSPRLGAVLFHLVEGNDVTDLQDTQDHFYSKIQSRLLQSKQLLSGRNLAVVISTITFAPGYNGTLAVDEGYNFASTDAHLKHFLDQVTWDRSDLYKPLLSVVQSITSIRKPKNKRSISKPNSRGDKLKKLEESIATLDQIQASAVIETVEGVQRIRGLAGSGKTIVLALKVAYLHAKNPDWDIAVTFHTRALRGQFERLINQFVLEQTNEEVNWDRVRILNAWGAPGGKDKEGIYYLYCVNNGVQYYDYRSALQKFGSDNEFDGACTQALSESKTRKQIFDLILVDEAQDLSPSFLRICYSLLNEPKRLIFAYDELQSLNKRSMPSTEEIFGKTPSGEPLVSLRNEDGKPKQDIVLEKCYRNSRPVLSTAHALGFGIYREHGLVQMFDSEHLWLDIGYKIVDGSLEAGKNVRLERTPETSPKFLEEHSAVDDLIVFKTFKNDELQIQAIVADIKKNLTEDELRPEDIIVINTNPLTTRAAVSSIRYELSRLGINSELAGVSTSPDVFNVEGSITFTGIYRAKGNEAGMVYIINAQDCFEPGRGEISQARNRLFTAMTRSKAWVRIYGVGASMAGLEEEFNKIKKNQFVLDFKYPTSEERKQLNILNRDMSEQEKKTIKSKTKELETFIASIEKGQANLADYPQEVIEKLKKLLGD